MGQAFPMVKVPYLGWEKLTNPKRLDKKLAEDAEEGEDETEAEDDFEFDDEVEDTSDDFIGWSK